MRVHTFKVRNIKEGLERIKHELGPAAVIVSTKRVPAAGGGQQLELSATVDGPGTPAPAKRGLFRREARAPEHTSEPPVQPAAGASQDNGVMHMLTSLQQTVQALTKNMQEMQSELRHMRLAQELDQSAQASPAAAPVARPREDHRAFKVGLNRLWNGVGDENLLEALYSMHRSLLAQGVLERDVEVLIAHALSEHDDVTSNHSIFGTVLEKMASIIETTDAPWKTPKGDRPQVHLFVGPAGVGKTTFVAKVAAHAQFVAERQVGLVCADTFRIGGRYQLETYAELMELPVAGVEDLAQLRRAITTMSECDCLLVDTTGYNPWGAHSPELSQLAPDALTMLRDEFDVHLHLVIAANTHTRDAIEWIEALADLDPSSLVFTKIDEARHLGALLSVARATGLPISVLSDGRAVPGDVHLPDSTELAEWILRGYRGRVLAETSSYSLEE